MSKIVLVTGCSQGGIGFALCEAFAAAGCKVYATARRREAMDGFSRDTIEKLVLDVTDEESRKSVINRVLRESGRIDVLVNNAGAVTCPGPILDVDMDAARQAFETNLLAPMRLAQLVIPYMAEQGGGIVVNVGSIAGNLVSPWNGLYSSTKGALHLMTDALGMECSFLNKNIKVMLVAPGAVKSNIVKNASVYEIPSNSMFKRFTQIIQKRISASQERNTMKAEEFSRQVVSQVLRKNPPSYITLGGLSTLFWIAQWFPRVLLRWVVGKVLNRPNQP